MRPPSPRLRRAKGQRVPPLVRVAPKADALRTVHTTVLISFVIPSLFGIRALAFPPLPSPFSCHARCYKRNSSRFTKIFVLVLVLLLVLDSRYFRVHEDEDEEEDDSVAAERPWVIRGSNLAFKKFQKCVDMFVVRHLKNGAPQGLRENLTQPKSPLMKKKSASRSAFFYLRVLLGFSFVFVGVALAIFAGKDSAA